MNQPLIEWTFSFRRYEKDSGQAAYEKDMQLRTVETEEN